MCGISGIFNLNEREMDFPTERNVKGMTEALKHRGPDSTGIFVDGRIALGAVRLAIIDLSPEANQPMVIGNGDYVMVFNGEIYNYIELRKELEGEGISFVSHSDSEVLLRLYMKKGISCLQYLRGMFAVAIWRRSDQSLFLARDRIGEKPLVYFHRNGIFAFASEIKALLTLSQIPREIDPIGLHHGLHYITTPAPYSAFKHIRKLRPGSYMIVSQKGITTERYWRATFSKTNLIKDPRDCTQELKRCLGETVKIMCRSDVPLGAMLSGGLDTGVIAATMAKVIPSLDTFCISHQMDGPDKEFEAARRIAMQYGTRHHERAFTPSDISIVPEIIRSYDEPVASFVPLHAHILSSFIKENVTVALTGSGGDELFGGYGDHRFLMKCGKKFRFWNLLDAWGIGRLARWIPWAPIRKSQEKYSSLRKIPLNRFVAEMRFQAVSPFFEMVYSERMKKMIEEWDIAAPLVEAFEECGATNLLDGFMYQQLMVESQHSIVDIPDISGMARSLEYRSPFLDVKMVELGMKIPWQFKVKRELGKSGGKWILRQAGRDFLPEENVWMEKAGFGSAIPYQNWALGKWSSFMEEKLRSPALAEVSLFDLDHLQEMYKSAKRGSPVPLELLWGVAMVAQWLEQYF
jgi:asparagine synthase (glutamine-hydrolysing)